VNGAALSAPDGFVVVDILTCGVDFVATLMIQGKYQLRPPLPFVPGAEVTGIVASLGKGVSSLAVGDLVHVNTQTGGFAEQMVAHEMQCFKLAPDLDLTTQPSMYGYQTSLFALRDRAALQVRSAAQMGEARGPVLVPLLAYSLAPAAPRCCTPHTRPACPPRVHQPGETLLVLGAAGGVGVTAVELGKCMGATVIAAASTPEKLQTAARLGADHGVNYEDEDLKKRVRELTGGKGVDVVFDPVRAAAASFSLSFRSLSFPLTPPAPSLPPRSLLLAPPPPLPPRWATASPSPPSARWRRAGGTWSWAARAAPSHACPPTGCG
jgi:NADPH2:quinone reductase